MVYDLSSLTRIREDAASIASESGVTENRFEDIRREMRERESTLRYAIIDLNLAKATPRIERLTTRGSATRLPDTSLESSLSDLGKQRAESSPR